MPATPFVHVHRITYAECTLGNHVYHSRYLDILEAARGEYFRALGHPLLAWQERGVLFPILRVTLDYHRQARYDDTMAVTVELTLARGARLNFSHRMHNQHGLPILTAESHHACTGLNDKPRRLPAELLAALIPRLAPAPDATLPDAVNRADPAQKP